MTFTRNDSGTTSNLKIKGALDALSTPELRPTIDALIAAKKTKVTVDLSELRLIDSSGVGAMISLFKQLREHGGQLFIVGLRDQPLAIFKLLRLDQLLAPRT